MNKNQQLILIIIIVVAAIYFAPKLGLFSAVFGDKSLDYSYSIYAAQASVGTEANRLNYGSEEESCYCPQGGCQNFPDTVISCSYFPYYGSGANLYYGVDSSFYRRSGSGYVHDLGFELVNPDKRIEDGTTYISDYLNFYYSGNAKADDDSLYPKIYYSINNPMSCSSTGCSGSLLASGEPDYTTYTRMDLSGVVNINRIYIASFTTYSGKYSYFIVQVDANLIVEPRCTEGELIQLGSSYYLCENGAFRPAYLSTLSPEQQAALLTQINALNATIAEKARLIQNLTNTLNGQVTMINALNATIAQKAQIIQQLSNNITYQAQLITQLQLTQSQQAETIRLLSNNITYQGQLIQQLQINLDAKIALIGLLQVENTRQAELIRAMNQSFQNQAYIIQQLNLNISSDAVIIRNLGLTVRDQANLINELSLQRDELARLVAAMNLSNTDSARLINELQLTVNDQIAIIAELNRSLQDEQAIVNQLTLTIEEQLRIIEALRNGTIPGDSPFDIRNIWANYKMPIIIAGAVLLLLLLMGGKKRR